MIFLIKSADKEYSSKYIKENSKNKILNEVIIFLYLYNPTVQPVRLAPSNLPYYFLNSLCDKQRFISLIASGVDKREMFKP